YRIRGRRTGKIYHLGDPVRIRVKATNLEQRILDYELIETGIDTAPVPPAGKKRVPRKKRTSSAK
ncbi:MAG: hypothetical protein IIU05_01290, partial [Bacteroidales bacterium]|nr:hypothetical protein [Bacteroidales bacterium]